MKGKRGKEKHTKPPFQDNRLITVLELSNILGISPRTIYNQMSTGVFPLRHKKIGRLVRFDIRELEKYLNSLPSYR